MNKKISLGVVVFFMCVVVATTFSMTYVYTMKKFNSMLLDSQQTEQMYKKINEINNLVRANFNGTIDEQALMDSLCEGYLGGLSDKYAIYYSQNEYQKLLEENSGTIVGIGVAITEDKGTGYAKVIKIYPGSPAEAGGVQISDLIVKIDGKDVASEGYQNVNKLLQGEANTQVQLIIRREAKEMTVDLARRQVVIPSVEYQMIDDNGYIKITEFNQNTPELFFKALDDVISKNAKGLIFDVRSNSGGLLDSVAQILDRLVPSGTIVSAEYKDGTTEVLYRSDGKEVNLPMVVLVNGNTASAAELFAQTLKDYNKATLVGVTTYGKGVMQTYYKLVDGSGIQVTTAKFNPPKSPNFDGVGIKPDVNAALSVGMESVLYQVDTVNDTQLKKGIDTLNAIKKIK